MPTILKHTNFYGSLTVEALEAFEQKIGSRLPDEYREFLLTHNGGVPEPAHFLAPDDPFESDDSPMSEREILCFFALHSQKWSTNTPEGTRGFPLQAAWKDFNREQPESGLLPIGQDWSGSCICVGLTGAERGKIYFYDHESEVSIPLAENLTAFVDGLS